MVGNPRGTSDTRRIRRLKSPRTVEVEASAEGTPLRLRLGRGSWQELTLVRRPWRIDQHWWRPNDQVSRLYYRVAPQEGPPLTLYRDMITGEWARQEY